MPIGIMGSDGLSLFGWGSRCFSKKEREAQSNYQAEATWASIKQP